MYTFMFFFSVLKLYWIHLNRFQLFTLEFSSDNLITEIFNCNYLEVII